MLFVHLSSEVGRAVGARSVTKGPAPSACSPAQLRRSATPPGCAIRGVARFRRQLNASGRKPGTVRFRCPERGRRIRRTSAVDGARAPTPRASGDPPLRPRVATRSRSGTPPPRPGSRFRWAPAGMPTTTASPRGASRPSRRSSSTAAHGPTGSSSNPRCSRTSTRSTTASAGIGVVDPAQMGSVDATVAYADWHPGCPAWSSRPSPDFVDACPEDRPAWSARTRLPRVTDPRPAAVETAMAATTDGRA